MYLMGEAEDLPPQRHYLRGCGVLECIIRKDFMGKALVTAKW